MHIKHMHEMIEKLTDCAKEAFDGNKTHVGQIPVTDITDMIKDLNEAEYYAVITKAMKEAKEEEKDDEKAELRKFREMMSAGGMDDMDHMRRMGYDRYRYANGRFAPKGRGRRMGFVPMWDEDEYMDEYVNDPAFGYPHMRMGYTDGRSGNRSGRSGDMNRMDGRSGNDSYGYGDGREERNNSRYGKSYDDYKSARRHYTENPTDENKRRMNESADEAWEDVEDIMRKIYKEAETQDKSKLKQKAMQFIQQL